MPIPGNIVEGGEHPIHIRTPRDGGEEQVLLDVNREAEGQDYFELGTVATSPDHTMLAWSRDTSGSEFYQLKFRVIGNDKDTGDGIADVGSVAWADAQTLFYTRVDEHHRPSKVFRHRIGSDPASDVLVYEENDPRFFCGVGRSRSGDYVFISTGMNDQDEVRFIPTNNA